VAVVQNGIIENYRSLREELQGQGVEFKSETDTEVIPHLVGRQLAQLLAEGRKPSGALLLEAVQQVLPRLHGAYALAVVWAKTPGALVVARKAAPLLIGLGEGEFLCASDTPALAGFTRTILPLEDGEVALLTPLGIELYDAVFAAPSGGRSIHSSCNALWTCAMSAARSVALPGSWPHRSPLWAGCSNPWASADSRTCSLQSQCVATSGHSTAT
jgi:glucosamine 6-phosphate synthetase-like amidotransferase/phosphosugar isomerase protein